MSIWSNGRAIQLKMPARRLKKKYRSMDRPCRNSWIGAHEIFQAREYDAGASHIQASQHGMQVDSWTSQHKFLKTP
jgi:hypothetical protein